MAKTDTPPEDAGAIANLQAFGAALAAGITDAAEQDRALSGILEQIGRLSPEMRKSLLRQPAIRDLVTTAMEAEQPTGKDDPPGTIYTHPQFGKFHKKIWTEGDMRRRVESGEFKLVTFVPIERMTVWFQGLRRQFLRGRETTVEEPFYSRYLEHLVALQVAEEHAAWMFDTPDTIGRKHHPVPSDPTVVTVDSARVRAGAGTREVSEGFGELANATTIARSGDTA